MTGAPTIAGAVEHHQAGRLDAAVAIYRRILIDAPDHADALHLLGAALGRQVLDLTALNDDLEAMLALVGALDDYVSVSNTNVHLRTALGASSRVLVPNPPEFRWMARGSVSPWFPGTTIYRQGCDGDWAPALADLARDLEARAG